jgi:hypothetical protein
MLLNRKELLLERHERYKDKEERTVIRATRHPGVVGTIRSCEMGIGRYCCGGHECGRDDCGLHIGDGINSVYV